MPFVTIIGQRVSFSLPSTCQWKAHVQSRRRRQGYAGTKVPRGNSTACGKLNIASGAISPVCRSTALVSIGPQGRSHMPVMPAAGFDWVTDLNSVLFASIRDRHRLGTPIQGFKTTSLDTSREPPVAVPSTATPVTQVYNTTMP
jgi:hypothetical protein